MHDLATEHQLDTASLLVDAIHKSQPLTVTFGYFGKSICLQRSVSKQTKSGLKRSRLSLWPDGDKPSKDNPMLGLQQAPNCLLPPNLEMFTRGRRWPSLLHRYVRNDGGRDIRPWPTPPLRYVVFEKRVCIDARLSSYRSPHNSLLQNLRISCLNFSSLKLNEKASSVIFSDLQIPHNLI